MLIVHTTLPDQAAAEALAQQLIEHRLAACVHIGAPIQARYRWQDNIEAASEIPLAIKTAHARYPALERYLRRTILTKCRKSSPLPPPKRYPRIAIGCGASAPSLRLCLDGGFIINFSFVIRRPTHRPSERRPS